jgi:uncharacterized protein
LEAAARQEATIFISAELLAEFAEVLSRPKFAARITARGTSAVASARKLADEATVITTSQLSLPRELRDPKDLPVLACAVAAHVDAIVTGDDDLLTLNSFEGIPILKAQAALRRLASSGR